MSRCAGGGFIDEAEKRGDVDADVDNGHLGQPGNVSVQVGGLSRS